MFALSGSLVAIGQDGTSVFSDQDKKSDSKQDKTKNKANNGHRRHFLPLPHLFHKKHDSAASAKAADKTVAAKNQPVASKPIQVPDVVKPASKASTAPASAPAHKTTSAHVGAKTGATTSQRKNGVAGARSHKKAGTSATASKKTGTTQTKKTQKGSAPTSTAKAS
jgi:hypothetical protein